MSELTFVTCPTCGLPAELLFAVDEVSVEAGIDAQGVRIRCINMHVSIISPGDDPGQGTGEPPPAGESPPAGEVRHEVVADPVVAFPGPHGPGVPTSALRRVSQALGAGAWRPAWFVIGALAAVLAIEAPLVGMGVAVLALLALPVRALLSARRSWCRLALPHLPARTEPEPVRSQTEEGRRAA